MIANTYLNAVRTHVDLLVRRSRTDKLVIYDIGSDEVHDPTLISQRVYGSRDHTDIIMLCAGMNRIGEALSRHRIYLPAATTVMMLRKIHAQDGVVVNGG